MALPLVSLTAEGEMNAEEFTPSRPAAEAGRDGIFLLIISSSLLLSFYLPMRRNLKLRKFSKYN